MRTKTLLCMAALTAAGVATSMAQSNVYSLNIVGYCNVPTPAGFSFQSNPLDAGVTNGANEVIPNTGQWDGSEIHEWTGVGYKVSVFDSSTDDTPTGFVDRLGNPVPPPVLTSGKGYLFNNGTGGSNVVTYVGNVRTGTNNLSIPANPALTATGSPLPLGGGIATTLNLANTGGALDGSEIQTLLTAPNGNAAGFKVSVYDSSTDDTPTGFVDRLGNPVPEPQITVGQGFFFNNGTGGAVSWQQILNVGP